MLILVHNHPPGELMPPKADLELTDQLIQVGRKVHLPVKDHLIITTEGYYSFERKGDLKRLRESKKYVTGYMQVEEIKKAAIAIGRKAGLEEGEKIGMKKGAKGKALEMAKESLKERLSIELISKLTGLSKEEIEKL